MHFVQGQIIIIIKIIIIISLKRAQTMSGAAILFCLVAMQRSVSDSESAPKRFLVTYRCIAKRYKALWNARFMLLIPGKQRLKDLDENIVVYSEC